MIIQSNIWTHPKFTKLRSMIGPGALEHLARLWTFCQTTARGENLGKVTPAYIEAICAWSGPQDQLFQPLIECGFIRVTPTSDIIAHGWNEHNRALITAWKNGKKGGTTYKHIMTKTLGGFDVDNAGQPTGSPSGSPSAEPTPLCLSPSGSPSVADGLTDRIGLDRSTEGTSSPPAREGVEVPSMEEVKTYGSVSGIPPDVCEAFWNENQAFGWVGRYGTPIRDWRVWLRVFFQKRQKVQTKRKPGRPSVASTIWQKKTRLDELAKLVQEHPGHPNAAYGRPPTKEERQEFRRLLLEIEKLRREIALPTEPAAEDTGGPS